MAATIVEALGPHLIYWEPFCGSMAVLLSKPSCRTEVVNDLHADLVNLARCIQDPKRGPALYRRLRRVFSCQDLFAAELVRIRGEAAPESSETPDLERAFSYFIVSWQGMNGVSGTSSFNSNFAKRFSSLGGDSGARWIGAVQSIPAWRKRLERVQILRCDGIELCEKIEDRDGTVVYADPPYLVKGAKYLHDFAAVDHKRLAKVLCRFRLTRVVVSYYAHADLQDLYPDWHVRAVDATKSMVNSGKRDQNGATSAPEVLLSNLPFAASDKMLFA